MRAHCIAGYLLAIGLSAFPAAAQAPSPTRELMGRAQLEAQNRSGAELLRRTENSSRYDAMGAQSARPNVPTIEGLATRSIQRAPKGPESRIDK